MMTPWSFDLVIGAARDGITEGIKVVPFLKCNPAGQWGWIAEETGLSIAEAIADELVRAA